MSEADSKNPDDETVCLWYFAIGSMMLPQSYEQRSFKPRASQPAELFDYKINFFGANGFAEALPATGESMHGVIHKATREQMIELDKIEAGYIRKEGKARPYGNGEEKKIVVVLVVSVYCRPSRDSVNALPRERYLEILIAGAKHFGVDPKYTQFLQDHPMQPRTLPKDFKSFGDPPKDSTVYTTVPKTKENGTVYFSLNGKVLEITYPPENPHGKFLIHMRKSKGPHFEVGLSQLALDLKYGTVEDIKDCTSEHSAYLEDGHYRFMEGCGELKYYKVIGTFEAP